MNKSEPRRFVIVPCTTDEHGQIITKEHRVPYGYHHILKEYDDGSCWLEATISHEVSLEATKQIAVIIAAGTLVDVDPKYYCR